MFDSEQYLNSLEAIGWKLGLDRMEALSAQLGRPQDRYDTVHVVGTNGKSSVTRMIAALLEAHGVRSGCSLSPHLDHWSQRVLVGGEEAPETFAAAVETTAEAAGRVNAGLEDGEEVTQFEVATAAAFLALAESGVEAAAIEAGLGGRLDATNTIESKVTALTSIGLDHTEWLGETEIEIAAEKLAVLRPGTTLVIGRLDPDIDAFAREHASKLDCEVIEAPQAVADEFEMAGPGEFQRDNFKVAIAVVEALIGRIDPDAVRRVAATMVIPGRLEQVGEDPPLFGDVAHNRPGAAVLAQAIPEISSGRPVIALIAILADKDAAGMLTELADSINWAVFTELPEDALENWGRPGARSFPAAELKQIGDKLGLLSEKVVDPAEALTRAISQADDLEGVILVTGSHYLLSTVLNA